MGGLLIHRIDLYTGKYGRLLQAWDFCHMIVDKGAALRVNYQA